MSAIGVLAGADGAFNPKGILTREQGAKIITYMLVGGQAAGDALTTTAAPFDDVAADRWSAGSIAYCKTLGIVGGVGDNKFDPTGTLTGYQFAKMLLVALGYDATIEKLGGDDWALNVAKLVTNINLSDGITAFAGNEGVSREVAAQLGYNTLRSTMVYYPSSSEVGTAGSSVNTSLQASNVGNSNEPAADGYRSLTGTQTPYTQLCEKYFPKLKLNTGATDNFKRPAEKWTLGGVSVGTYNDDAKLVYTEYLDTEAGRKQIEDDIDPFNNDGSAAATYGAAPTAVKTIRNGLNTASADTRAATIAALTGNGRQVEIYASNNEITDIIVIDTVIGQVTKVDSKNEKISVQFPANANGSVTAAETLTTGKGYGTFVKDDYVLVTFTDTVNGTIDAGETNVTIRSVAAPQVVTGIASTKSENAVASKSSVTVGGTTYKGAAAIATPYNVTAFGISNTKTATLLLDSYGYIAGAKAGTSAVDDKSVAVLDEYNSLDSNGRMISMILGVTADGETVRWQVSGTSTVAAGGFTKGQVYAYTEDGSAYKFTGPIPTAVWGTATTASPYTFFETSSPKITSSTKTLTLGGGTAYVDGSTNFIYLTKKSDGSYKATVVSGADDVAAGNDIWVALRQDTSNNTYYAAAVYVLDVAAPVSAGSASDVVFVKAVETGKTQVTNSSTNKAETFKLYDAWVDGESVNNFCRCNSSR